MSLTRDISALRMRLVSLVYYHSYSVVLLYYDFELEALSFLYFLTRVIRPRDFTALSNLGNPGSLKSHVMFLTEVTKQCDFFMVSMQTVPLV